MKVCHTVLVALVDGCHADVGCGGGPRSSETAGGDHGDGCLEPCVVVEVRAHPAVARRPQARLGHRSLRRRKPARRDARRSESGHRDLGHHLQGQARELRPPRSNRAHRRRERIPHRHRHLEIRPWDGCVRRDHRRGQGRECLGRQWIPGPERAPRRFPHSSVARCTRRGGARSRAAPPQQARAVLRPRRAPSGAGSPSRGAGTHAIRNLMCP